MFYHVPPQFSVQALQQVGTNVVRFQLVTRERQWYIFGCYFSPDDALNIECVLVAVGKRPCWSELLVAVNFNADLTVPEGAERDEEITADLAEAGLEDILLDFHKFLCPWNLYKGMWIMFGMVSEVWSRTDYILYTYRCLFRNMSVRDPRHNLDNYLILGCLRSATLREHENYFWRSTRLPLRTPTTSTKEGGLFVSLCRIIPKTKAQEARKITWILAEM